MSDPRYTPQVRGWAVWRCGCIAAYDVRRHAEHHVAILRRLGTATCIVPLYDWNTWLANTARRTA